MREVKIREIRKIKNLIIQKRERENGCFSVTTNTISFSSVERFVECPSESEVQTGFFSFYSKKERKQMHGGHTMTRLLKAIAGDGRDIQERVSIG